MILIIIWWLQGLGKDWQKSKEAAQKFGVERFNLRKLNKLEVRKHYEIKISKQVCSFGGLKR